MRLIIGILAVLAFGGLALEIGIKLGAATLTMVLVVAGGILARQFAIARANRNAKHPPDKAKLDHYR